MVPGEKLNLDIFFSSLNVSLIEKSESCDKTGHDVTAKTCGSIQTI